jgi:hypothetical protein
VVRVLYHQATNPIITPFHGSCWRNFSRQHALLWKEFWSKASALETQQLSTFMVGVTRMNPQTLARFNMLRHSKLFFESGFVDFVFRKFSLLKYNFNVIFNLFFTIYDLKT